MTSPTSPPAAPEMTDKELAQQLVFMTGGSLPLTRDEARIMRLAASRLERRLTDEEAYLLWRQEQRQ